MNPTYPQLSNIQNLFKPPSAIVYSKDFEPIAHVPMNEELYKYFMEYDIVKFPVHEPLDIATVAEPEGITPPNIKFAEVSAIKVLSLDGIRLILTARDDETALLLRNTFLPGQTKELNYIKTQAFYKGMLKAIKKK